MKKILQKFYEIMFDYGKLRAANNLKSLGYHDIAKNILITPK